MLTCFQIALAALGFFITMMIFYNDVLVTKAAKKDTVRYISLSIQNNYEASSNWNKTFSLFNMLFTSNVKKMLVYDQQYKSYIDYLWIYFFRLGLCSNKDNNVQFVGKKLHFRQHK